jgi:hypothetical protein
MSAVKVNWAKFAIFMANPVFTVFKNVICELSANAIADEPAPTEVNV